MLLLAPVMLFFSTFLAFLEFAAPYLMGTWHNAIKFCRDTCSSFLWLLAKLYYYFWFRYFGYRLWRLCNIKQKILSNLKERFTAFFWVGSLTPDTGSGPWTVLSKCWLNEWINSWVTAVSIQTQSYWSLNIKQGFAFRWVRWAGGSTLGI